MIENIESLDLASVAGAGAAAFIVAQFCKTLLNLNTKWIRIITMLTGLVVVVFVQAAMTQLNPISGIIAVLVGMQAGLSAQAMFDNVKQGIDHKVFSSEVVASNEIGLALPDNGELEIIEAQGE